MDTPIKPELAGTPDRREALRQIASGAFALAAIGTTACAPATAGRATLDPGFPAQSGSSFKSQFDMSWLGRINKRRRTVFDTNDVMGGIGLGFVSGYLEGAKQAYGDPDASTVLVHRHASVPIVLNDEMWRRLGLGESLKLKDPTTGETAMRNPFIGYKEGDKNSMIGPTGGLDYLMKEGTIVCACNRALTGMAYQLANKEKIDREQAKKELFANIVPGVYVVPNGVFGVCAAQEAGCGYISVR